MTAMVPGRLARQASGSSLYRRRRAHDVREQVVDDTGVSKYALEKAQLRGLVLVVDDADDEWDEIERARQVKIVRDMAVPLGDKRKLRSVRLTTTGLVFYHHPHVAATSRDLRIIYIIIITIIMILLLVLILLAFRQRHISRFCLSF